MARNSVASAGLCTLLNLLHTLLRVLDFDYMRNNHAREKQGVRGYLKEFKINLEMIRTALLSK